MLSIKKMAKTKDFTIPLTESDFIDVKLINEKNKITGFVINYRTKIKNAWYQVYRVDTCHGYLHEQRFWISPEPIPLPRQETIPLKFLFNFFMKEVKNNYEKYKKYYKERMRL